MTTERIRVFRTGNNLVRPWRAYCPTCHRNARYRNLQDELAWADYGNWQTAMDAAAWHIDRHNDRRP